METPSERGSIGLSGSGGAAGAGRFSPGAVLFDRYSVVREIGRGGMGVVLLARDAELEIDLALKLIPDLLIHDDEALDDLKQEVLRGMTLTHPGIVRTHGLVRDDHTAAILMEYVDGGTFHDLKRLHHGGCFDHSDLLPWIEQLCPALDHAHFECHVAHRDLKPRNLMYTMSGRIKIADFGISSNLGDAMTRATLVSGPSSGTPAYMSPQQIMGGRPSHLDDIYSLGATIYELLTGRPPFHKGEIIYQVLDRLAMPMNAKREELGVVGKVPIPEHWEQAVAACLSKDPDARPQSAGELLTWLHQPGEARVAVQGVSGEPVEVRAPAGKRQWGRSHWLVGGALGLTTAVALMAWWWPSGRTTEKAPEPAVPLLITSVEVLPAGTAGLLYQHQMAASGGEAPYRWSMGSGRLPEGLVLQEGGQITGVPLQPAVSRFEVLVSDSRQRSIRRTHEIQVGPQPVAVGPASETTAREVEPLRYTTGPVLPPALSGSVYRFEVEVVGGVPPVEWSLVSGGLPDGLVLGGDGVLTGVPTRPGMAGFTLKAKDSEGAEAVLAATLEVSPPSPPVTVVPPRAEPELIATKDEPFENSLGMRFVPAGTDGVYFSVWLTRVKDFSAFVTRSGHDMNGRMLSIDKGGKAELKAQGHTWDSPGFNQTENHPVCGVSWADARAFCSWLTTTEQEAGTLPSDVEYRLPTDAEWQKSLGIDAMGNRPTFPWGDGAPPGLRCNLAGEEIQIDDIPKDWKNILGFRDNAPFPSPVDHFPPNQFGLHDPYGNLWQICDDITDSVRRKRLLRGGSWLTYNPAEFRLDSKFGRIETGRGVDAGFRCVIAPKSR